MTANPAPGFLQMQPMNGQWVGRYAGTNSGLLIIDLDGMGAHYEGRACAYDDNQFSILLITLLGFTQNAQPVPGKTSDGSGKADEQVQREAKRIRKRPPPRLSCKKKRIKPRRPIPPEINDPQAIIQERRLMPNLLPRF